MKQKLAIRLGKQLSMSQNLAVKRMTLRERLLRLLLGKPIGISIIVPGDKVNEVEISGIGGQQHGTNETATTTQ